ncbi:hypothetical protein NHX12_033761 [Muraenolepis orangiensis]|uniref:Uncharacterized protein n=1 Tax=Muraenolepis orangiensis TaxID=630683 RepID=A0A9Q0E8A4_9TELE|nr:hypothetical protein NHX12_033761 [Muraenolepis orangiensis]
MLVSLSHTRDGTTRGDRAGRGRAVLTEKNRDEVAVLGEGDGAGTQQKSAVESGMPPMSPCGMLRRVGVWQAEGGRRVWGAPGVTFPCSDSTEPHVTMHTARCGPRNASGLLNSTVTTDGTKWGGGA